MNGSRTRRGTIQGLDQAGVEAASGEGSSRVIQEENRVRGAPYVGRHPLASRAGNPHLRMASKNFLCPSQLDVD